MGRIILEHIQSDGTLRVRWVEQNHILRPFFGNSGQDILDGIAVRIDEAEAFARNGVFLGHLLQIHRLAHPRLADDIHMAAAVIVSDADIRLRTPIIVVPEEYPLLWNVHRRRSRPGLEPLDFRRFRRRDRKMENTRQLFDGQHHLCLVVEVPKDIIIDGLFFSDPLLDPEIIHFRILELSEGIFHMPENLFGSLLCGSGRDEPDVDRKRTLVRFGVDRFDQFLLFRRQIHRFFLLTSRSIFFWTTRHNLEQSLAHN